MGSLGANRLPLRLIVETALCVIGVALFMLLASAYVRGGQVVALDDDVSRWVATNVTSTVAWVARPVTWLGGAIGATVVAGATVIALYRTARRRDAIFVALAVLGVTALVAALKAVFERARPDAGSSIALPHSYSFPSGHAATAVVLYGALGVLLAERAATRLRAAAWLLAAGAIAFAVGVSRIVLNVHFVSDVAAGFAVGLAWLCFCLIVRDVVGREHAAPRRVGS